MRSGALNDLKLRQRRAQIVRRMLDVCAALPVGVPKYVFSTVAFSPLIPPERLAADIRMILWAGGLHGLNSICKSSLSQAAGAVPGAAAAVEPPARDKPGQVGA